MELEQVKDEHYVLRRVPYKRPNYIKPNGELASFAFSLKKGEDGVSVDLEHLTTYESSVKDPQEFHLYQLKVAYIREKECNCKHDPKEDNKAHALIINEDKLKKRKVKRYFAEKAIKVFPE